MIGIVALLFPVGVVAAVDAVLVNVLTSMMNRIIRPTLRGTAFAVKTTATSLVPRQAGALAESLGIGELEGHGTTPDPFLKNQSQIRVSHRSIPAAHGRNPRNYALWLHQGHVIIAPRNRNKRKWAPGRPAGGEVVGHVDGTPYMTRAANISSPLMGAIVSQLTRRHLGNIARGHLIELKVRFKKPTVFNRDVHEEIVSGRSARERKIGALRFFAN